MAAGFAIRIATADYPLWRDELASMVFGYQPLSKLWSGWMLRETNPPLFYSMLHLWRGTGVQSVVGLRILPIMGGVAAIGLVGLLCRRLSGDWAGASGAAIAAVAAWPVWFSQELRGYIFEVGGLLVALLGLLAWLDGERRARAGLVAYVLGTAFGFYCHVTFAVFPIAVAIALVALDRRWLLADGGRSLAEFTLANAALGLICLWWIGIAVHQLDSDNIAHIRPLGWKEHLSLVWHNSILIMDPPPHTLVLRLGLTATIVAGAGLLLRKRAGRLLIAAWLLSIVLFHVAEPIHPIVKWITINWFSQFSLLALATLLGAIPWVRLRWAATVLVLAVLAWNLVDKLPTFWWEDWRGAFATLQRDPRAIMLVEQSQTGMHANWACKVELRVDKCTLPIAVMDSRDRSYGWAREFMDRSALRRPELDRVLRRYARVYVVDWGGPDPLVSLGLIPPHPCCVAFMRGPFSPQVLLSGKYPQQLP